MKAVMLLCLKAKSSLVESNFSKVVYQGTMKKDLEG